MHKKIIPVFVLVLTLMFVAFPSTATAAKTRIPPTVQTLTNEQIQTVLEDVCQARGYGDDCVRTLLGMMWKESRAIGDAIGDGGRARGYFQIHYKLHKISIECAEDIQCSAQWSLDYLESNGYPKYPKYAVQCHNSCNVNNGYALSALGYGKRLWSNPEALIANN